MRGRGEYTEIDVRPEEEEDTCKALSCYTPQGVFQKKARYYGY